MKTVLSYSSIFDNIDEIIKYLKSINYSDEKIETLKIAQKIVLSFELMNLSYKQSFEHPNYK